MAETNTTRDALGRIRKAIVAGASAGASAAVALLLPLNGGQGMLTDGKIDAAEAGTLAGAFFTAGVTAGYLAWQTPNNAAKHASPDVATIAAEREVQNLALPEPDDAALTLVSNDAPTDAGLPAPGRSAAGLPSDVEPKHRAVQEFGVTLVNDPVTIAGDTIVSGDGEADQRTES